MVLLHKKKDKRDCLTRVGQRQECARAAPHTHTLVPSHNSETVKKEKEKKTPQEGKTHQKRIKKNYGNTSEHHLAICCPATGGKKDERDGMRNTKTHCKKRGSNHTRCRFLSTRTTLQLNCPAPRPERQRHARTPRAAPAQNLLNCLRCFLPSFFRSCTFRTLNLTVFESGRHSPTVTRSPSFTVNAGEQCTAIVAWRFS